MTRFATWNVNSLNVRQARVEEWIADVQPDILCMQETKLADEAFPALLFEALGYESVHHGEGRWNGVAILSRVGLDDVVMNFADGADPDAEARVLTATVRRHHRRRTCTCRTAGRSTATTTSTSSAGSPASASTSTRSPGRAIR